MIPFCILTSILLCFKPWVHRLLPKIQVFREGPKYQVVSEMQNATDMIRMDKHIDLHIWEAVPIFHPCGFILLLWNSPENQVSPFRWACTISPELVLCKINPSLEASMVRKCFQLYCSSESQWYCMSELKFAAVFFVLLLSLSKWRISLPAAQWGAVWRNMTAFAITNSFDYSYIFTLQQLSDNRAVWCVFHKTLAAMAA